MLSLPCLFELQIASPSISHFVPVGNAYITRSAAICLAQTDLYAILSGVDCFCLHSAFLCSTGFVTGRRTFNAADQSHLLSQTVPRLVDNSNQ